MANKATAGKVSSTLKAGSPSNASLKSVSKSGTKIPKRQATVTLVSTGKQAKNLAATPTVMTLPASRAKAAKSIVVEPAQNPPKKATQKTASLGSARSSNNTAAKEAKNVTKIPKLLKTKSARNPKNAGRAPAGKQDITGQEAREVDTSLVTEAAELTQLMAFDTDGARLGDQFSDRVPDSSIKIFQIYYHERQSPFLDPAFEPYDNGGDSSPLLEFNVFTKLLQSKEVQEAKLWGALSWKFGQKTGISGAQFKKEIAANPGYDVYFCNPHAETEALYHNLWLQGETAHPNFLALCKEVFEVAGLSTELLTEMQPSSNFATANYFVATPAFWKRYATFVSRILLAANKKLSSTARAILFSSTADPNGVHAEASYIPFIVERLFSVFLRTDGREFLAYKISPKAPDEQINVHLRLLGEMRNVAFRTKSVWMASCWVNYRNLYFTNAYGAPWAKRYLRSITPQAIVFAPDADNITFEALTK